MGNLSIYLGAITIPRFRCATLGTWPGSPLLPRFWRSQKSGYHCDPLSCSLRCAELGLNALAEGDDQLTISGVQKNNFSVFSGLFIKLNFILDYNSICFRFLSS